jgi:hypothetical protein
MVEISSAIRHWECILPTPLVVETFSPADFERLLARELDWLEVLIELDRQPFQFARFVAELVIKGRFRELRN